MEIKKKNHWCDYIEGDFTFICVIAGFNAAELTPKYPDFISARVYALTLLPDGGMSTEMRCEMMKKSHG